MAELSSDEHAPPPDQGAPPGDLSALARRLIDTAMARDEPPPVEDSWGTMVTRLSAEAAPALTIDAALASRASPRRAGPWLLAGLLAVVTAGGAWWWSTSRRPTVAPPPTSAATEGPGVPSAAAVPAPAPARPSNPAPAQLLRDAEAALRDADAARALALLQRHAQLAPLDPDAPLRMALRVRALCRVGLHEQARDEAKALLAAHPQPRWRAALRDPCVDPLLP